MCQAVRGKSQQVANELLAHNSLGDKVLLEQLSHSEVLKARTDYTGFAIDRPVSHREAVKNNLTAIAQEYCERFLRFNLNL